MITFTVEEGKYGPRTFILLLYRAGTVTVEVRKGEQENNMRAEILFLKDRLWQVIMSFSKMFI
jgi:hypothetical protein